MTPSTPSAKSKVDPVAEATLARVRADCGIEAGIPDEAVRRLAVYQWAYARAVAVDMARAVWHGLTHWRP